MEKKETLRISSVDEFITQFWKASAPERKSLKLDLIEGKLKFTLEDVLDKVSELTTFSGLSVKTRGLEAKLEEISRSLTQTKAERRAELNAKLFHAFANEKTKTVLSKQREHLSSVSRRLEASINKKVADARERLEWKERQLNEAWTRYTLHLPSEQKRLEQPGYSKLVIGTIESIFSGTTKDPARFTDPFLVNRGVTEEPIHTLEKIARAQGIKTYHITKKQKIKLARKLYGDEATDAYLNGES